MTIPPTNVDSYAIDVIGRLHSCFPDKFGVPRQPGLSAAARGEIEILPPFDRPEAFRGLEGFSHIWVTFLFHQNLFQARQGRDWQATIRPPRLGGNKRIGVFASRSSFRPNGLGLSLLKLTGVSINTDTGTPGSPRGRSPSVRLNVQGVDMIDQTPIVDIKPYLPYADSAPDAEAGWAEERPTARLEVRFSVEAEQAIAGLGASYPGLGTLIVEVLGQDPRPSYRRGKPDAKLYGTRLFDLDVRWRADEDQAAWVIAVAPFSER